MNAVRNFSTLYLNTNYEVFLRLKYSQGRILKIWEERVRSQLPLDWQKDPLALIDSLSGFLGDLAQVFSPPEIKKQIRGLQLVGRGHGEQKSKVSAHQFDQVLFEFHLLRKTIFEVLEEVELLTPLVRETILDVIYSEVTSAALVFIEAHTSREQTAIRLLDQTEEYFRDLIDHLDHVIIWEMDARTKCYKFMGNQAKLLLGSSTDQCNSESNFLKNYIFSDDHEHVLKHFELAYRMGITQQFEHRMLLKDGGRLWFQTSLYVKKDESGRVIQLLGVGIDITALKKLEEEHSQFLYLSRMDLNLLREEREIRDRFVATLTHDLRTPLTTMRMSAELIQKRPQSLAYANQELVKNIIDAIDRTDQMIKDLLDATSIRAGQRLPIKIVACDLRQTIIETIASLSLAHGDRFIVQAEKAVHGHWFCNGLRRAIENLVGNAIKYGDKNSLVTIALSENDGKVCIAVHNRGRALTPDEQAVIFQPFRRTLSAQTGVQRGWGLGLILVRGIAEAHGGIARVESSPERGTTFIVEIPKDARPFQPVQESGEK